MFDLTATGSRHNKMLPGNSFRCCNNNISRNCSEKKKVPSKDLPEASQEVFQEILLGILQVVSSKILQNKSEYFDRRSFRILSKSFAEHYSKSSTGN